METSLKGTIHEKWERYPWGYPWESILSRENSQYKGFEKWAHFSNSEETRVSGAEWVKRQAAGYKVTDEQGGQIMEGFVRF